MRWYIEDLDPSIANKVAPIDGDIAFWQHLTQFTVGIGVKGTLDASSDTAKASTLAALTKGTATWPDPSKGNPQKIDDLWHAAVNTGGTSTRSRT
jgi:type IV pilus assembly protein PilY1